MTTKSVEKTTWNEAFKTFRNFLDENGESFPILWVFKEDVFSPKTKDFTTQFWVRLPIPLENEKYVEASYQRAQKKGVGVGFSAFARCDQGLCCSVIIPADEEDAQYMLMSPAYVKYSLVQDMPHGIPIRNRLRWWLFSLFSFVYEKGNYLVYLRSKREP